MTKALTTTDFKLPKQTDFYRGKVRDVYTINDDLLVMVATDRISAFDVVLPEGIPYKGQVLNTLAANALSATDAIVPNWLISTPHANVSIGRKATTFPIEMVIRGYLSGHAWREYSEGKRELCGEELPEGLIENDRLPEPIITPSTKANEGHDEDISAVQILAQDIVSESDYEQLAKYTKSLFRCGTKRAEEQGLILVDTKYEFGKTVDGEIILIDEIHTPDSSRFFYLEGYEQRQQTGQEQRQLSKEFVRKWLIENGFQGKEGQKMPDMNQEFVKSVSERYMELYEQMSGSKFEKNEANSSEIEQAILESIKKLQ